MFINNIISFKKLPFYETGNVKLAKDYEIPAKSFIDDDHFVKMSYDPIEGEYSTDIYNECNENIAKNQFIIDNKAKELYATNMDVWNKEDRNKGFGGILHLNNIMEMIENKLKTIKVFSLAPAIFFHGKYHFEPQLTNYDDIVEAMFTISTKDCTDIPKLQPIVDRASKHFDNVFYSNGFDPMYDKNIENANKIVKDYVNTINKERLTPEQKQYYAFNQGFIMMLSKENIINNKDFFNNLFKKHSIDYEI